MLKQGARGLGSESGLGRQLAGGPGVTSLLASSSSVLSYLYCWDPAMKMRSEKVGLNSWLFSPSSQGKGVGLAGGENEGKLSI